MAVHKLRRRYGRKIQAEKLEFHPRIGAFEGHLLNRGNERSMMDQRMITAIRSYKKAGRPMDYIDFIAHAIRETGSLDPETLSPYARSFRRLTRPNAFFKAHKEQTPLVKGRNPSVFRTLIAKDLFREIKGIVFKAKKPITATEITTRIFGNTEHANFRDVIHTLNVFDALGEVNKLPIDATKGRHKDVSYLPVGRKMPVPNNSMHYSIMRSLLGGPKDAMEVVESHELKRFAVSKDSTRGWGDLSGQQVIVPAISYMIDEGLISFSKRNSPRTKAEQFVFRLTPAGKKHVDDTEKTGELSESFRRKLLGTKHYGLSEIDGAHLNKVVRWVRVKMADEWLQYNRSSKRKRRQGSGPHAIADMLDEKPNYVQSVLYDGSVPHKIMSSKPEHLKKFLLNIDDLDEKAWLWKWLKKEKRI